MKKIKKYTREATSGNIVEYAAWTARFKTGFDFKKAPEYYTLKK